MFDKLTQSNLKVLNLFLEDIDRVFYLREIAKVLKISPSTTKLSLDILNKLNLLEVEKRAHIIFYKLNMDNLIVRELKKIKNIELIKENKLVEKLMKANQNIISILVYGSFAKGNNTKNSDIDLLIITTKKTANFGINNINGYELNIDEFTPRDWSDYVYKENKPFYNEIITNNILLYGSLPVQ